MSAFATVEENAKLKGKEKRREEKENVQRKRGDADNKIDFNTT